MILEKLGSESKRFSFLTVNSLMYNSTKPYKKDIFNLIRQTWETPYVRVKDGWVEEKLSYPKVYHVDGIGSKGIYHWKVKSFRNAVLDALAMNLNDLAFLRATPYALTDHLFLPQDDHNAVLEITRNLAEECKNRQIAITGGETAIHEHSLGFEISITMLGFVKNFKPNQFQVGDILIGIESSGLHANGFTKIREVFGSQFKPEFTIPTYIYWDIINKLDRKYDIHGLMHITGGAFTKLKDLLTDGDARIAQPLEPQPIFREVYERGVSDKEMYKTFNCGTGFVLGLAKTEADQCLDDVKDIKAEIIGEITPGSGHIGIKSRFSGREIWY